MKFIITAQDKMKLTRDEMAAKCIDFIQRSGVSNVIGGDIHIDERYDIDAIIFTAYFDSSTWTGRN